MAINYTLTAAQAVFTVTDNFDDTETLVIGGKTYTINATVGTTDGSVDLGTNAENTLLNLAAAVNLKPTEGSTGVADADYASGMTKNLEVEAISTSATVITFRALTPGTVGKLIATTDTHGEGTWAAGASVMTGGVGTIDAWAESMIDSNQLTAEIIGELQKLTAGENSS